MHRDGYPPLPPPKVTKGGLSGVGSPSPLLQDISSDLGKSSLGTSMGGEVKIEYEISQGDLSVEKVFTIFNPRAGVGVGGVLDT